MDFSTETASLAPDLLRLSSHPSQSFVFSPFSLNTALSIIHDGANGTTQKELTHLLLKDVTDFYSSLVRSINATKKPGVSVKTANRFYVDDSISLKNGYQKHVEDKYEVKVKNIKLRNSEDAAKKMNKFVKRATNRKIKDVIDAQEIDDPHSHPQSLPPIQFVI